MTDLDIIVLFAIRYALPRNTSAPFSLLCYLSKHVDKLSIEGRKQIKDEILRGPWEGNTDAARDWKEILGLLDRRTG